MIWAILTRRVEKLRYVKAEPPCRKGELCIPLFRRSLTIGWGGWGRKAEALKSQSEQSSHPESKCQRCGGRNITWFTGNALWNKVVPGDGILCPLCFVELAEAAGVVPTAWRLTMESESLDLQREAVAREWETIALNCELGSTWWKMTQNPALARAYAKEIRAESSAKLADDAARKEQG